MKISKECELGNFYIGLDSFCEGCGHVPNEVVWSNGYTYYCLDCAEYNEEFEEPTEEMMKELESMRLK